MGEKPQDKKGFLKECIWDLWVFFRNWSCYVLNKGTGNKCEDHKISTIIIGLLCLYFISSGVIYNLGSILSIVKSGIQIESNSNNAAAVNLSSSIKIRTPQSNLSEKAEKCNFNNGRWIRWYGNINQSYDDKSYFILPTNSAGALFKYAGKIEDFSNCEFSFVPRSENSLNYVISLDGIYQIVIGDNDLWTVTLKTTDRIGGELIPVKEKVTQRTRPRLLSKVKSGTVIKAFISQRFLEDEKYEVMAEITYKPDNDSNEPNKEKFTWVFDPSPAIANSSELSVGLIRDDGDISEIGASFIYPNPGGSSKR